MKRRILSIVSFILMMTFIVSLVGCNKSLSNPNTNIDVENAVVDTEGASKTDIPEQNANPDEITESPASDTDTETKAEGETEKITFPQLDWDDFPYHTEFDTIFDFEYGSYDVNVDMEMDVDINVNTQPNNGSQSATDKPTQTETQKPTEKPTEAPTDKPTETEKEVEPETEAPTEKPTEAPTEKPTEAPTEKPTEKPTEAPTEAPTEPDSKLRLRFGSYNIKHGEMNPGLDKIAANIVAQKLDIVALQEVDKLTNRSGKVDQLKKLSQLTGYQYYAFFKAIDHDGGEYGIGILSKYPFENTKVWDLTNGSYENRVIARAQFRINGTLINFYATHLTYDGESKSMRTQQFAEIAKIVKTNSNFIIAGDFNTSNFSEFNVLDNHTTLDTMTLNNSSSSKYTEPASKQAIDNIVFRKWTFGTPQVVTNSYSDHYMLWGEATFNG